MTLTAYMDKHRIRLKDMASKLGCPSNTVHGWISGRRRPSWDHMDKVFAVTAGKVQPNDFLPPLAK